MTDSVQDPNFTSMYRSEQTGSAIRRKSLEETPRHPNPARSTSLQRLCAHLALPRCSIGIALGTPLVMSCDGPGPLGLQETRESCGLAAEEYIARRDSGFNLHSSSSNPFYTQVVYRLFVCHSFLLDEVLTTFHLLMYDPDTIISSRHPTDHDLL